ncbi:hypothetical protein AMS62_04920 [Bacillus sp. FJAT-18019]|nr:hypothetical protein AMS62_04920 [Bacillus sp. FJAT-18019]
MILEKRQRSPLHPDFYIGLFIHGNLGATEIGRIIRMRSDAKKLQADIAMLWEQEVRGPYKPRIKKDDISFFANVVFDYYLLAL